MGWLVRAGLFAFMLIGVALSAWIIVVPIGVYFAFALSHRGGKREKWGGESKDLHEPGIFERIQKDRVGGLALIVLALVAAAEGGMFSVIMLLALGALVFFRRPIADSSTGSRVEPVNGSILLRRKAFPLKRVAVAEIKPSGGTLSSLLTSVHEKVVVSVDEKVSIYALFEKHSLDAREAEAWAIGRMRRLSRALAPSGAYVLPLDSSQACERFGMRLEREKVEEDDWPVSFGAASFNLLVMETKGGFVEAFGAYTAEKEEDEPRIPPARQRLKIQPLFVEALEELEKKVPQPQPDELTSFLANLCSARGEPQGRVLELERSGSGEPGTVSVSALSSPPVELSRVQLRAAARVYLDGAGRRIL